MIRQHNFWRFGLFAVVLVLITACGGESEQEKIDIEPFLTNSKSFLNSGQFQAAIIESRNAIQSAPDDSRGHTSLAKIFIEIGQPKQATIVLESIEGTSSDFYLTAAKAYLRSGKLRSASDILTGNAVALSSMQTEFDLLKGELEYARGRLEEAEAQFEVVLARDSKNVDASISIARIDAAQREFDEAEAKLDAVLVLEPENPTALLFASSLQSRKGKLIDAEDLLMEAISATPNTDIITPIRFSILTALRDILTQQGKTSEALIYSQILAESTPGVREVNEQLQQAMEALEQSDFEGAKTVLGDIQTKVPGSERAGTMLGVVEFLQGNNVAAVKHFEQFVDPETASSTALQMFALAELNLNQPQKVLDQLSKDIDNSADAKLVALYGIASVSANEPVQGELYLKKAVKLDPENGRVRLVLVRLYNGQLRFDEALEQATAAFKSQPEGALIQAAYVEQLMRVDQLSKATGVIKGIESSYPNLQDTQLLVGRFHLSQRAMDQAMSAFEKVLSLGESQAARHQIARIQLSEQDFGKAEASYRKIIELNAEDDVAYKGLITVYELKNNIEQGIKELIRISESNNAVMPKLVLVEFYGRNGDFDDAFKLIGDIEKPLPTAGAQLLQTLYIAKAEQALNSRSFAESRQTILEGLTASSKSPKLLALLVGVELGAENIIEAEKVYAQLIEILPNAPILAILAGDIAVANGSLAEAVGHYKQAWDRAPSDQVAIKYFAALSRQTPPNNQEMIRFLNDWEVKSPASMLAKLSKAGHYLQTGDTMQARLGYESLLKNNDNIALAHNNLAWIYGEKELVKAVAAGKRGYELAPQNGEIIDTYAWFLYKSGDLGTAKELLTKAVELSPGNEEIRQHFDEVSQK
ncbi:MAG: tetratricopeptide (TPR) repeat protein [Candidatus Azotimanducaceae bacterium]|jgi:tetratricopeptide (TPR) repeat protein